MIPRTQAAYARSTLLWTIAGFAVLQLGLAVAIEGGLMKFRDPFYEHKVRHLRRRLAERRSGPGIPPKVVVMLGSSRTGNGLKGTVLEAELSRRLGSPVLICNLGVPGAGPVVELLNFERLKAEGIRPDYLLIEVMPVFLAGQEPWENRLITADRLRLADLDWLDRCQYPARALRRSWWESWAVPWHNHRFAILSDWWPKLLPASLQQTWAKSCDETGWVPIFVDEVSPQTRGELVERVRRQYQPALQNFQLGGPSSVALRQLLEECRCQNLPAALVLLPEAKAYQDFYGPGAWAQVESFLNELHGRFGCPVIDARSWVPDDGLCDSHHLMRQGAERFTRRLARQALPPMLPEGE
jgi:uncharacterized protein DUF1574